MALPVILCLHGYGQNENVFGNALQKIKEKLEIEKIATLVPVTAPHFIQLDDMLAFCKRMGLPTKLADGNNYRWWDSQQDGKTYVGVDDSLKFVSELFEKHKPIGLLGFSQGGIFSIALSSLHCKALKEGNPSPYPIKFIINFAGFPPRAERFQALLTEKLDIPSLHIIGEQDIIKIDASAELFVDSKVVKHEGGHSIPRDERVHNEVINFVKSNLH